MLPLNAPHVLNVASSALTMTASHNSLAVMVKAITARASALHVTIHVASAHKAQAWVTSQYHVQAVSLVNLAKHVHHAPLMAKAPVVLRINLHVQTPTWAP